MKGIIDQAIDQRESLRPGYSVNRNKSDKVERQNPKILDITKLKEYVEKVLNHMTVKDKEKHSDSRKFTFLWEVPVHNILGYVDEPTWVFMIEKQANWCIESRELVQPNGRWHIFAHEFDMITRHQITKKTVGKDASGRADVMEFERPVQYLRVGIQLVDTVNERDLKYDMGRPTNKNEGFDPKLLKALMKDAPSVSNNEYQTKLVEQDKRLANQSTMIENLQTENQKTNELMAALLSELQELKGQRKIVTRGRKKKDV